ncbi:unnamed protein product [Timema podura]|uniref:Uncharacterized protein n=1 Tax=Timema podura TaxID=61482 RepID=A0ABN7NTH4_TIMPD|nr:unnamed protein product [Timema podura]
MSCWPPCWPCKGPDRYWPREGPVTPGGSHQWHAHLRLSEGPRWLRQVGCLLHLPPRYFGRSYQSCWPCKGPIRHPKVTRACFGWRHARPGSWSGPAGFGLDCSEWKYSIPPDKTGCQSQPLPAYPLTLAANFFILGAGRFLGSGFLNASSSGPLSTPKPAAFFIFTVGSIAGLHKFGQGVVVPQSPPSCAATRIIMLEQEQSTSSMKFLEKKTKYHKLSDNAATIDSVVGLLLPQVNYDQFCGHAFELHLTGQLNGVFRAYSEPTVNLVNFNIRFQRSSTADMNCSGNLDVGADHMDEEMYTYNELVAATILKRKLLLKAKEDKPI